MAPRPAARLVLAVMGHTHVLSGMAGWLIAGPAALTATERAVDLVGPSLPALTPGAFAAGVLVAGGAGMWPDVDSPGATIARTYGPLWQPVARAVSALAGGHREATHSVLFLVVTAAGTTAALLSPVATAIVLGAFIGLCLAGLGSGPPPKTEGGGARVEARVHVDRGQQSAFLYGAPEPKRPQRRVVRRSRTPLRFLKGYAIPVTALAGLGTWAWVDDNGTAGFWWLPVAVTLGALVHDLGDFCTRYGVPWLWPARREWRRGKLRSRRYELGLFTTADDTERLPITIGLAVGIVALIGWRTGLWAAVVPQ